ncbi:hypothetical protein Tco_0181000 [Tanacetum coccineum]
MLKDNTLILGNVPSNQNMNKDSMARLAEASAAVEAMATNGMWEAAQAHAANPIQIRAEIRDRFLADSGKEYLELLPRHALLQNMTYSARMKVQFTREIMSPRVMTQSAGRPAVESLGGGTGVRVGRGGRGRRPREGNDERVDEFNGQGNDQDLLPTMLAQVGNQGNVGNHNGNVVNENVQENVRNVLVNGKWVGCSYKKFLACDPKEYDGKGGVVVLTRWIEKMESVHDMSGCSIDQKVKYTDGSLVGKALMWWNSQIHTLSREVAVSMSWNDFKFMMIEEFCPSHEMQKLETGVPILGIMFRYTITILLVFVLTKVDCFNQPQLRYSCRVIPLQIPKGEMKAITTRSGVAYEGPSIPTNPSPKKVVEREIEETKDKEQSNFQGSTTQIPPPVIPISILEPDVPKTLPLKIHSHSGTRCFKSRQEWKDSRVLLNPTSKHMDWFTAFMVPAGCSYSRLCGSAGCLRSIPKDFFITRFCIKHVFSHEGRFDLMHTELRFQEMDSTEPALVCLPPSEDDNNEKEKQEVKNLAESTAKRQTRISPCLKNFKPKDSLIMGDEHLSTFSAEEIVPIPRESEDTSRSDRDDIEILLHHDPSTPMKSIASILEGFIDDPLFEENDDLFNLECKTNDWKRILYDAPIDKAKCFDPGGDNE